MWGICFNTLFWKIDGIYVRSKRNTENRDVKTKKKMKIEICHFDGTGRNILIFHTKNGGGKLIFCIDVTKWCMFTNIKWKLSRL